LKRTLSFKANWQPLVTGLGEYEASHRLVVNFQKVAVKTTVKTAVKILRFLETNPSLTLADVAAEIEKRSEKGSEKSRPVINSGYFRCYVKRKGTAKGGYWEVTGIENE